MINPSGPYSISLNVESSVLSASGQEIRAREINSVIKNEMSFPVCPACGGNVGFTHYANRKPHTSQVEEML